MPDTFEITGTKPSLESVEVKDPNSTESSVTYHQQVSYCGKARCRKCREGVGHGPYWYAYRNVNGRTVRSYIGKKLPADVQEAREETTAGPSEARLKISLLGQFKMERRNSLDWNPVTDAAWQHQRVRSLLACLLSSPGRKLGREQVIDALWPDLELDIGIDRLNRAVHSLRQVFEPSRSRPATSHLLRTEREMLLLADQSQIWTDADAFEYLINEAHKTTDAKVSEDMLQQADELYGGIFLPEEQEALWAVARREALQRNWIGLLLELADLRIKAEDLIAAVKTLDKLFTVDPENEAAVQRLIILLSQMGRRSEALQAYKRLKSALKNNYDIEPLSETQTLYEAIRAGEALTLESAQGLAMSLPTPGTAVANLPRPELLIGRRHQSKLIGRDKELQGMRDLLQTTRQGKRLKLSGQKKGPSIALETPHHPQCVLLMGDAGIGKTRLAEELGREAKKQGWAIAWSRVYAQESQIPYRIWIEALRKAMDYSTWHKEEVKKNPLVYNTLSALLPELHDMLPKLDFSNPISPEQEQLRLREATLDLLTIISDKSPLLVVLDDLHWADASSCELLAYIARHQTGRPLVLVATCRENELGPNHPLRTLMADLQREQVITTVRVDRLTDEQIGELVEHLPQNTVSRIKQRAGGNPFFAEELARVTTADGSVLLPETIAAVLDLRLGSMSEACQKLLAKASVIDGSFKFQLLHLMDEGTGGGNTEDKLLDLLEEAQQAGVLAEEGAGTNVSYHFWHPLMANHLYQALSAARRARLHRQAATSLKQIYESNEEEAAGIITSHLINGGAEAGQIAYYAMLAGDHALGLSAYSEAEGYYRQAIEQLEVDDKQKPSQKKQHDLAYMFEQLAECRRVQGDFEEARQLYERVLKLHNERHGTPSRAEVAGEQAYSAENFPEAEQHYRLAIANLEATIQNISGEASEELQLHLADLLEQLGECRRIQGDFEEARHIYERVLSIHKRQQKYESYARYQVEAQLQALLWREVGQTWYDNGDNIQARRCCAEGEKILRKAEITSGAAWATLHLQQSFIFWMEGDFNNALQKAYKSLKMFEEANQERDPLEQQISKLTKTKRTLKGDPIDVGRAHALIGMILGAIPPSSDTQSGTLIHLQLALEVFERYDNQREMALVCGNLGNVYLLRAEHDLALAIFWRSLRIAERIGDIALASAVYCNIGLITAHTNDLVEAKDWFGKGLNIAKKINDQIYISIFNSSLGMILQEQGEFTQARSAVHEALVIARAIKITPCIGQALVTLGNLYISQFRIEEIQGNKRPKSNKPTKIALQDKTINSTKKRLLLRAKKIFCLALELEEIDPETRIEGHLGLAQVSLLLQDLEAAEDQVRQMLKDSHSNTLTWLEIRGQKLLGDILVSQGKTEQAEKQFLSVEERLHLQSPGIEFGRTLLSHGKLLLQKEKANKIKYQQGLDYIQQAMQIFERCHAIIEQQHIKQVIEAQKV